jgi:hypothetical protein
VLPRAGHATIEILDVQGRRIDAHVASYWTAGTHQVVFDTRNLAAGVYTARLTAAGGAAVVSLVHLR